MFDWGDFKEDGKLREENRVKNNIFHCLAKEGKHRGRKIREKILSRAHNSHLPKSGGKFWGEKWTYGIFTQMPFPTYSHSWPNDLLTYIFLLKKKTQRVRAGEKRKEKMRAAKKKKMYTIKNWTIDEINGRFKRGNAHRTWQ